MGGGAVRDSEVGEEGLWQGNRARTRPVQLPTLLSLATQASTDHNLQTITPLTSWPLFAHDGVGHGAHTPRAKRWSKPPRVVPENRCSSGGDLRK